MINWYPKNDAPNDLVPTLNNELADRSKSTALGNILLFFTLFEASTKLHFDDVYSEVMGGILVFGSLVRYFLSKGYDTKHLFGKMLWERMFPGAVLITGLCWGFLTSRIIYLNGFSSPLSQISLLILSGITSSSLISLGPCPRLLFAFLNTTLLLPMGIAFYVDFGQVNIAFPVIFALYYGFLLYQAPIYFQNLIKLKISEEKQMRQLLELQKAEQEVRELNEGLKNRVTERTRQLEETNQRLETEISDRKRAEEINYYQAHFDAATHFPNHFSFHDHLSQTLKKAWRENVSASILLIDIDRFWEINSTLGHFKCNLVIQEVGSRIRETLRESDILARFERGMFAVLLENADPEGAILVIKKIQKNLIQPLNVDGLTLYVEISAGISSFPHHGQDAESLIQRAEVAMYIGGQTDNKYFVYSKEKDNFNPQRLILMGELRNAIDRDELFLLYQPKINLKTKQISGVEALVRWKHPDRGIVPPDQFIGMAEQTGLIKDLTFWCLKSSASQRRIWEEKGIQIRLSVNLSARSLMDPNLPNQIGEILKEYSVSSDYFEFEITESALMVDPARALENLTRLSELGFSLSIDDFGTGYSSLGYLKKLPVNTIKIDKSFVLNMTADSNNTVIVRSTIDLAHNLGLDVVAEGVETEEVLDLLTFMGCDMAQGYFMSRPISPEQLNLWLAESIWGIKPVPGHTKSSTQTGDL
ncbi:MAG: putative bifunctional diguanylate cyclase/phosphodiesterase [Nitrospiria bacterium]